MQHVVLATAGHIDHGKTLLTRALTGIDTDRLPEEKARGITIDLGFAHLELGGRKVAIIDVPGHERFIKNMLAGVGGIDIALLIVAADESVMPQTREHLAILDLLGVGHGVVALTKRDLVDAETLAIATDEARAFIGGTFLADAAIVPVSARTGEGLAELRAALTAAVERVPERDARGPFREHVDRAFSIKGFGTVVTGTVIGGRTRVGDELELTPTGRIVKVRGIEVHGGEVDEAHAGSRAALNLAGVDLEDVERGQELVSPGRFVPTSLADARLKLLPDASPLADLGRVRFHLGAAELLARVKLLGGHAALEPGQECWVQLRFERPMVMWPGDRFIVRSYSPMATIGGGAIVDTMPEKHRGRAEHAVAGLERLARATAAGRLELLLEAAAERGRTLSSLVASEGRLPEGIEADLRSARGAVRVEGTPPRYFARGAWEALEREALRQLKLFHTREPLRDGMSREELRGKLLGDDAVSARHLLDGLAARGELVLNGDRVAARGHAVQVSSGDQGVMDELEQAFRKGGLSPDSTRDVLERLGPRRAAAEKLLPVLVRSRRLVLVPGGLYFHADAIAALRDQLAQRVAPGAPFSVAQFKEWTGISRKFAIPLLEYLDSSKFTRRVGDSRVRVGG